MRIKIVEPGWAGFTGDFGMIAFVDGVSVEDLGRGDASNVAALIAIVDVETGKNPSASQRILDQYSDAAAVEPPKVKVAETVTVTHTKETLEAIADKAEIGRAHV
jgi:hypothetical protein